MTYAGRHAGAAGGLPTGNAAASDGVLLAAEHVVVAYGPTVAVDDVGLILHAGELIAVTGSSGSGKTSLLSVLAGTAAPDRGTVSRPNSAVVIIRQDHELAAMLTAIENVALPLLVAGRSRADARSMAEAVMAALGVQDAADQLVDELSGGQQQRVAVARGLVQRAAVLLADEPTSELDSGNRNVVLGLLRDEAERGGAVLVATNDPAVAELCDAELRLSDGRGSWIRDDRSTTRAPDRWRNRKPAGRGRNDSIPTTDGSGGAQ